jgi:transposase
MFLKKCYRMKNERRHAYWALVESYRTERGPRHRIVAYLGDIGEEAREGYRDAIRGSSEPDLFRKRPAEYAEVDIANISLERCKEFGSCWLGLELMKKLGLPEWARKTVAGSREDIPWSQMLSVLVLCRFSRPSSELHIAEHFYESTALSDLLGIPDEKVNDDRLYRTLDRILPFKNDLEKHLKERMGELFKVDYDLMLYDVTSTYFEGEAKANALAERGYSRDQRGDCKQVCIGLVVTREGLPLGYELFAGNTQDVTTVKHIVLTMEGRYGKADRIWVMDRGMISKDNLEFLRDGRRYILGAQRSLLKKFKKEFLEDNWKKIRPDLEVKLCFSDEEKDVFILCRSGARKEKEKAIHERFASRIRQGLEKIQGSCARRKHSLQVIAERVGALTSRNSRASSLFDISYGQRSDGGTQISWSFNREQQEWLDKSDGAYVLQSNVTDWSAEDLWKAYIQLTDAEEAFRIHKTDMRMRPVWHQKTDRVAAHIFVCFVAFVLWKTLEKTAEQSGLGNCPRKIIEELSNIKMLDVILKTRNGITIRRRCVTKPTEHQAILLHHLKMNVPSHLEIRECSQDFQNSFVDLQGVMTHKSP